MVAAFSREDLSQQDAALARNLAVVLMNSLLCFVNFVVNIPTWLLPHRCS